MAAPDYSPMLFRRVALLQERTEALYTALHLAVLLVFVAILVALWIVRDDILAAIERNTP